MCAIIVYVLIRIIYPENQKVQFIVQKYFDQALANLTQEKNVDFAGFVYSFCDLFENKQEYCIAEAAEFFHFDFKKEDVKLFVILKKNYWRTSNQTLQF